jgi:hypothetical protein
MIRYRHDKQFQQQTITDRDEHMENSLRIVMQYCKRNALAIFSINDNFIV